ncbi:putative N-terminal nucleophile aminohydrolases (Ntn hydrolases) superfamily protein [Hibiscus syriacus]|uniref:N-terminal nucleophile aminohydrolases (Ntn hydrolases) superfamily protein n=1 Tax=Hibiscus syriacus TaxID=106335 RepID=A0A6A2XNI1_HIBSY|nr:putative N-terminal nucleophile aminohydrolases (Ntn hydrolases) superfamily protein [Hibiscus syriacus]
MKSGHGVTLVLLFLFVSAHVFNCNEATSMARVNGSSEMVPLVDEKAIKMMKLFNESRRKLGSFQICAVCTCCGGAKGVCLPSLVATQSIATFQTDPLASVLSLPKPVIALDAISKSLFFSRSLLFSV